MKYKKIGTVLLVSALAASFVLYRARPGLLMPKTPGSFEYVRTGEELLDRGEYKKAIVYFEKAKESSPENKNIQDYLIVAYLKYSAALVESDDFDAAIKYLTLAYEIRREIATVQNLANALAKKAVRLANGRRWAEAAGNFNASRDIAKDSVRASKNLAIQLFNDGVEAYNAGREEAAILCLKESSLIEEQSIVFEFLGHIYYKKSDYDNALFHWDYAGRLDKDNKSLEDKLKALIKEKALVSSSLTRESPHFLLVYDKTLPFDAPAVKKALESAYFDVGEDLGYFPDSKTKIFFYSQENFREIFKLPVIVGAFYDGNIRMPLPEGPLKDEILTCYIYHEYTHAVISAITNNNCPVWFGEGLAVWEEFRDDASGLNDMITQLSKVSPDLSIRGLDEVFKAGHNVPSIRLSYVTAYTVVRFISERWGQGALRGILKNLASGQHIMNAIDDTLLLSEKEFESRWREYIMRRL